MKEFRKWFELKRNINNLKKKPYFSVREVWFCSLGCNVGYEQDGKGSEYLRPVVVFRKFNNDVCLVIPMTKTKKKGKYYYGFYFNKTYGTAILSQIRLVDVRRFKYKVGNINKSEFIKLKEKLRKLIF